MHLNETGTVGGRRVEADSQCLEFVNEPTPVRGIAYENGDMLDLTSGPIDHASQSGNQFVLIIQPGQ
jgi:hypothetical protein